MFLNSLKYEFLVNMRNKDFIIWLLIFPIALGGFFKVSFANLFDKEFKFSTVDVAVVENEKNATFNTVVDELSKEDEPLLKAQYVSKDEALEMLENEDVSGIIYTSDLSLSVKSDGIEPTILKSFLSQYKVMEKVITDTAKTDPQKLPQVIEKLNSDVRSNESLSLTDEKMDPTTNYFNNLIAMVAICGMITGLHIPIENQGNLSSLGARKCCSPVNKFKSILAALIAAWFAQAVCCIVSVSYVQFVLKIDFGSKLPFVYTSAILGGIMGVSLGFFVGSLGTLNEGTKTAIGMCVSLGSCFLNGLMLADMKPLIMKNAPLLNDINPASVIADSFYSLQVYSDYKVYITKLITMLIITVIFVLGGFLTTRRRKYASL